MDQTKLTAQLQKIMEQGYQQACYHFKVIPHRKIIFKGFYRPEVYEQIFNNQEILTNLKINTPWRKECFWKELQNLVFTNAGMALPTDQETWTILNPYLWELDFSEALLLDCVETLAHETSHAVVINIDLWRSHESPHPEITAYLKVYFWKNYNWKKILIGNNE